MTASSSSRSVVLSSLSLEQRESLLFSLASEIDPNNLHFSLLPDADNANRDPNMPVVAVTWKLSRRHPVLSKIGGTEFPQYHHQSVENNNNNFLQQQITITPRKGSITPTNVKNNNRASSGGNRRRTNSSPLHNYSVASPNNNNNNLNSTRALVIEQILTVSPVIRGSPTPFVATNSSNYYRKPSPFHNKNKTIVNVRSSSVDSNGSNGSRNNYVSPSNHHQQQQPRSPQWAQRYVEEFLHFASKSGVDTVQHNSISFAVQCFLQYQSAVASTIRHDFHHLERAVESYKHVCPACRLLYFLWKECDDFSGVAALSYVAAIRCNDQIVGARQVISLTSKVQTVAGHTLLINRKYLRANETVGVLRLATKRWNMHASSFAKRQLLSFLKSFSNNQHPEADVAENAIAFDYVKHVDFYSFLYQLGKCYVRTNAGRSGPVQMTNNINNDDDAGENNINGEIEQEAAIDAEMDGTTNESYAHPEKVGGGKYQQNQFYASSPKNVGIVGDVNVSPNTPAPKNNNNNYKSEPRNNQQRQDENPVHFQPPASTSSYAQRFQEKRQNAKINNNNNQQYQDPNYEISNNNNQIGGGRSASWVKRIDSAQQTLQQVMKQFDSPLSRRQASSSPRNIRNNINNTNGYALREFPGDSSPQAHANGRRILLASSNNNNNNGRGQNLTSHQEQPQKNSENNNSNNHCRNQFVETVVIKPSTSSRSRSVTANEVEQNEKAGSTSAPRARSFEPPQPSTTTKNKFHQDQKDQSEEAAEVDPISFALAEQVRKTLEARQQQQTQQNSRSQSEKSQLEMIAGSP